MRPVGAVRCHEQIYNLLVSFNKPYESSQLGGVMHTVSAVTIILIVGPFHILLAYENFLVYEFASHPSNDESCTHSTECLPNIFTMYLSKT